MVLDFTVIIPTYNEEKAIAKTLQYVKNQKTNSTFKIVVVDGGSNDNTVKIAKEYAEVLISPQKGKAYQLNYAANQTDSKFLLFLDADTHIPWDYLERVKTAFYHDQDLWACSGHIFYSGMTYGIYHTFVVFQGLINFLEFFLFSSIYFLLQRLSHAHFKFLQTTFFFNVSMLIWYSFRQLYGSPEFSGSNICIRRNIFDAIGGFRQPPHLGVDHVFCYILKNYIEKKKRGKMKIIPSLFVETDVRNLGFRRSLRRVKTYSDVVV